MLDCRELNVGMELEGRCSHAFNNFSLTDFKMHCCGQCIFMEKSGKWDAPRLSIGAHIIRTVSERAAL